MEAAQPLRGRNLCCAFPWVASELATPGFVAESFQDSGGALDTKAPDILISAYQLGTAACCRFQGPPV
jgi:hypothetical protein